MQKVVGNILVNYEQVGTGKGDLVIFPGWKGQLNDWMPIAEELSNQYRVTIIELPGFGNSGMPPTTWGIYEYADFAKDVLKKLGIKRAVLIGHSFGGRVAILLSSRTEIAEKLVLVDAAGMEVKSLIVKALKILKPMAGWFPERIRNRFRSEDWKNAGQMRPVLAKVLNQPLRGELVKIKCMTLIIWGEFDKELTLDEAKMLKKGIKNSQLRIVWGATHWPHNEKYEEFIRILKEEGI